MKDIDLKEFVEFGFLQEANRQFFHPHGLALSVTLPTTDDYANGDYSNGVLSIQDARDDPGGFVFAAVEDDPDWRQHRLEKYERVLQVWSEKAPVRIGKFGFLCQPADYAPPEEA